MSFEPHTPKRTVKTNAFNKNQFKGNYEVITEADLTTTLYVYEPVSLATLVTGDSFLYQQVWSRFQNGGRILVSLVPYYEQSTIKVKITSRAGDYTGLERDDIISAFTNVDIDSRPTKRFYANKSLYETTNIGEEIKFDDGLVLYEENNFVEIINNDDSIKQYGITLEKVKFFEGGDGAYYRDVKFYLENYSWVYSKSFSISTNKKSLFGNLGVKSLDNKINERTTFDIEKDNELGMKTTFFAWDIMNGGVMEKTANVNPHFTIPLVTSGGVKWMFPWVWEYLYAKEQWDGEFEWKGVTDSSTTSDKPGNSINGDYTYDGSSPEYKRIKSSGPFESAGKLLEFFLPYTVEWGLPRGISSHGSVFYQSTTGDATQGLLGLGYDSSSLDGARPETVKGPWAANSSIFALDNAYDGSVIVAAGHSTLYLSEIVYGKFYQSEDYKTLIEEVLRGSPIYQGTSFNSDMGVLEEIQTKSISDDIRTWNQDNDWNMYLTSGDVIDLSSNLAYEIAPGPSTPKIDTGLLDFQPMTIQTNDTRPFNNVYTDENYWEIDEFFGFNVYLDDEGVGEIDLNYYSRGDLVIILHSENEIATFIFIIPSEIKEGRSKAGGTKITFL